MKRIINYVFITIFISLLLFTSLSCDLRSDEEKIEDIINNLITSLENNDKEGLRSQFAEAKIENIPNFDDSLDELLDYYDGTLVSKSGGGNGTDGDLDDDFRAIWFNIPCKIVTSTGEYRIAIYWCDEYTTNSKELGIWSLYIIKEEDYLRPKSTTYRGDGLWTPGINIGKNYVED